METLFFAFIWQGASVVTWPCIYELCTWTGEETHVLISSNKEYFILSRLWMYLEPTRSGVLTLSSFLLMSLARRYLRELWKSFKKKRSCAGSNFRLVTGASLALQTFRDSESKWLNYLINICFYWNFVRPCGSGAFIASLLHRDHLFDLSPALIAEGPAASWWTLECCCCCFFSVFHQ